MTLLSQIKDIITGRREQAQPIGYTRRKSGFDHECCKRSKFNRVRLMRRLAYRRGVSLSELDRRYPLPVPASRY